MISSSASRWRRLRDPGTLRYLVRGLTQRWHQLRRCPDCGSAEAIQVDRKFFHALLRCTNCLLCYRYPAESAEEMAGYYQQDYESDSIATELPDAPTIAALRAGQFAGTDYDRSWHLRVFQQLGMRAGAKVLDFGCSWGCFVLQLQQAGFDAHGYELSRPRAQFGARAFDLDIWSDLGALAQDYDVVCSTHVIEHVPQPTAMLAAMLDWVNPGGLVMGYTPNGGAAFAEANRAGFSQSWGRVHPVLLSADGLAKRFPDIPLLLTSDDSAANLATWAGQSRKIDACAGAGLLFALRRPSVA